MTPHPDSDSDVPVELGGRRARKALAVRRALFDAGLAAFERQPIALVSVLDITEAADVAKGVFYLQFRSKDEFLLALWQDVQTGCLAALRRAVADPPGAHADRTAAVAWALLEYFASRASERRYWIRMASYFPDEVGLPGELERVREEYARGLAAVLAGVEPSATTDADLDRARVVDAVCWATLTTESFLGRRLLTLEAVAATVRAATAGSSGSAP